jgi:alpha-glucosidase
MFKTNKISESTTLFRSGKPLPTGAVLKERTKFSKIKEPKFFSVTSDEKQTVLTYQLSVNDKVFGLGENLGGLNKRGKIYRMFAVDNPNHSPERENLYCSHPFFLVRGEMTFGVFLDFGGEIVFDIGFTDPEILSITIVSRDFDLYVFDNSDLKKIIKEYLSLTGTSYIPPKWAFGYQQSRWSYKDKTEVLEVAKKFRELKIPCDAIYLDLDYMDNYKVFTVNKERFPNFADFVSELKEMGFRLVPIIDPGVKIEKGYSVYEEGISKNYFCKTQTGENFVAAVWPGLTHFPDFLNENARDWWGQNYKKLTELGIEGFWNDMNEPAIFYSKEKRDEAVQLMKMECSKQNKEVDVFRIKGTLNMLQNNRDDFENIIHTTKAGEKVCQTKVHNLFGFNMTRAFAEVYKNSEKRYLIFSRSSYAGAHRFSGMWTGDNSSCWEHLYMNIKMMQSLNLCGFTYSGADIGGFGNNTSEELLIRWMQLGIFIPLFRNHSAICTRRQEPWSFSETSIFQNTINLRYSLIPYIYSEFMQASMNSATFLSPLFLEFESKRCLEIDDQFMVGKSIMSAPIYKPNSSGRYVHLPKGKWLYWQTDSHQNRNIEILEPGDHYIEANLNEVPIFIKENSLLPLTKPTNYVDEKKLTKLKIIGFVTEKVEYEFYEDDGISKGYLKDDYSVTKITITKSDKYEIQISKEGGYKSDLKEIEFEIFDEKGKNCNFEYKEI